MMFVSESGITETAEEEFFPENLMIWFQLQILKLCCLEFLSGILKQNGERIWDITRVR